MVIRLKGCFVAYKKALDGSIYNYSFYFKITIKWNLTKSHATRLKSGKYKTHMIKEQLLKWMSYNKMNQSHGLSYDETLFISYQKVPKVKDCLFLFKGGWSLLIRRLFITIKVVVVGSKNWEIFKIRCVIAE